MSGADISEFASHRTGEATQDYDADGARAFGALANFRKPLIAMIHGFCVGGGVALSLAADLRYAADDAVFAIPAARLGLGYHMLGVEALGGLLAGALISGVPLALMLANAGGAWDNAKKYIEKGEDKDLGGKGSDAHKAAVVGEPYHAAYSASKGAVLSLTRALAIELAPHNITVNAVCPGPVLTDMLLEAVPDAEGREELAASAPLGRVGRAEDIVGAVLYLASEESDWCTGQAIVVDGGLSVLL